MKFFLLSIALSSTALATTYECNFVVKLDGKEIGTLQARKAEVGMTMGSIAFTRINEKKNVFGKVTKWDELQLYGTLQNAGETDTLSSEIKNYLHGKIAISSYSQRQGIKETHDIAVIKGTDNFDVNSNEGRYTVSGNCASKP
jgi:hypothetical protein